jgi:hypothetical protein
MDIETSSAIKFFFPNPSLVQVLFEALANSLDAGASDISVSIEIDSFTASDTLRFTITDNGSGFDETSFDRFSQLLKPRDAGHKGLGRLVYLNYFDRVEVDSIWDNKRRNFTFSQAFKGESAISELAVPTASGTKLIFKDFSGQRVKSYDDLKPGALKPKIIEQFLPTLYQRKLAGENFIIRLSLDVEEARDDKEFFSTEEIIRPDDLQEMKSVHITDPTLDAFEGVDMLYKIRAGMGQRQVITAASIDGRTIPINLIQSSSVPPDHSVICLFFSKLFHGTADSARQKLVLPEGLPDAELRRVLQRELGKVLSQEIEQIGERNEQTKEQFVAKFPHLLGYFEEEAVGLIDKDEALDVAQRRFFKAQKAVLQAEELDDETYEKSLELSSRSLTEYILYREKIIHRMKEMNADNSEKDIHNLIVPRYQTYRQDGLVENRYRNNAWLLDDKFMTFQTILSEARMDQVVDAIRLTDEGIGDDGRPDIAIIFSGDPADSPQVDVVVVEIKKKTDDEKENLYAVNQLLERAQKLVDHCPNIQRVWYYAVLQVNEILDRRLQQMKWAPLFSIGKVFYQDFETRRPDGHIVPTPTFILSFDAIIGDAECRNHTFLEILRSGMKALERVEDPSPLQPAPPAAATLST